MEKSPFLQLEEYKKRVAALEKEIGRQHRRLLALPGRFGFTTVGDMVDALQSAAKAAGTAFQAAKVQSARPRKPRRSPQASPAAKEPSAKKAAKPRRKKR